MEGKKYKSWLSDWLNWLTLKGEKNFLIMYICTGVPQNQDS